MYNKILLPIDLNHKQSWDKALPTALNFCQTYNASLHIITVLPDFGLPLVGGFFPREYARRQKKAISGDLKDFVAEQVPRASRCSASWPTVRPTRPSCVSPKSSMLT
ncbi:universal stress protein [Halopseudomonas pachastrellae]|nr:universal stress protein [Halopseudomonas pachastrellae]